MQTNFSVLDNLFVLFVINFHKVLKIRCPYLGKQGYIQEKSPVFPNPIFVQFSSIQTFSVYADLLWFFLYIPILFPLNPILQSWETISRHAGSQALLFDSIFRLPSAPGVLSQLYNQFAGSQFCWRESSFYIYSTAAPQQMASAGLFTPKLLLFIT